MKEEIKFKNFIKKHLKVIKPLNKQAVLAYWEAAIHGDDELYKKAAEAELKIRQVYSNIDEFTFLKEQKDKNESSDPLIKRQIDLLYYAFLENQVDPDLLKEMVELGSEIEKTFSNFRATVDGKKVTGNKIDEILKDEENCQIREKAWLAGKQVALHVAKDIIKLVKLRNKAAKKLDYCNYHTMALMIDEQSIEETDKIFEELENLTVEPFKKVKEELDKVLADKYGIKKNNLMPWHYQDLFFQEAPQIFEVNLDKYYKNMKPEMLAAGFFKEIGLPVESILKNSDLFEKPGKNPHAFCTDIDRKGDIRILCNLKDNERWMETILHELGHAVYDKYHEPELPYLLREPAHIFTTEGIAMFFGRLSSNAQWMQKNLNLPDKQKTQIEKVCNQHARLKQLIFVRWSLVMYHFEKHLYDNPDQDLNRLWWELVEKFQMIKKPEGRNQPDWAAKIHFAIAPCYYHNYLLGELFASQISNSLYQHQIEYGEKMGQFLTDKVFKPGKMYSWNEMITKATGEPLTAKYFVEQFMN